MSLTALQHPRNARSMLHPLWLLALCAACASTGAGEGDVAWLIDRGQYTRAVAVAREQAQDDPGDERAQERLRFAMAAVALAEGRELTFQDRDEEALARFLEARALVPDSMEVVKWIANANGKLADRYREKGQTLLVADDLEGAAEAFERALAYEPEEPHATAGLARVLLQINYRAGVGEKYYREGIKALDAYRVDEARARFAYTRKYTPKNERAQGRYAEAGRLLASTRAAEAHKLEASGMYGAARNEYRIALLHDKTQPDAVEGFERMRKEEQVAIAMRTAENLLMRQRHEEALAALEGMDEITVLQKEALADCRDRIGESRLQQVYDRARSLELDGLFEESLSTYDQLLALTPFFLDAIARRDTLQSYITEAGKLYAQAEAAANDEERARLLRRITVFWPQYRDVTARLQALDAAAPPAPAEPGGG